MLTDSLTCAFAFVCEHAYTHKHTHTHTHTQNTKHRDRHTHTHTHTHRNNVWRQAAVDAENAAVDDGGDIEVVEHFRAVLPGVGVAVLALAFFVEAIYLCACA